MINDLSSAPVVDKNRRMYQQKYVGNVVVPHVSDSKLTYDKNTVYYFWITMMRQVFLSDYFELVKH